MHTLSLYNILMHTGLCGRQRYNNIYYIITPRNTHTSTKRRDTTDAFLFPLMPAIMASVSMPVAMPATTMVVPWVFEPKHGLSVLLRPPENPQKHDGHGKFPGKLMVLRYMRRLEILGGERTIFGMSDMLLWPKQKKRREGREGKEDASQEW